ncbi:hypothetical protein [Paenibacillus sp. NFR01]|uniref:hypothetical protein n=1 Tax=Paenibacillus sp. NFR01 TaxID=1566279 RepID=UPI0008D7ABC5|nr:hypothetical protein [Paenibacillus sp. NFR01]SET38793.1 hypothetical protein SAMN03159358_1536 [Paenibacillus sp. NFR01]
MKKRIGPSLAQLLFPESAGSGAKRFAELGLAEDAERVCRLKFSEGNEHTDICLQIHTDYVRLVSLLDSDPYTYTLKDPAAVKRACYTLFGCKEDAVPAKPSGAGLLLSRVRFAELEAAAHKHTLLYLAEQLRAETGDLVSSAHLANALKYQTCRGELHFYGYGENGWEPSRASYIENGNGGWLLRISGNPAEDWMIAIPAEKPHVCAALYAWTAFHTPVLTAE